MKKFVNNKMVDMTPEEIDEYQKQQPWQTPEEPSLEERISSVEEVILNLL